MNPVTSVDRGAAAPRRRTTQLVERISFFHSVHRLTMCHWPGRVLPINDRIAVGELSLSSCPALAAICGALREALGHVEKSSIWALRLFWLHLTGSDLRARFCISWLGALWCVVTPLAMALAVRLKVYPDNEWAVGLNRGLGYVFAAEIVGEHEQLVESLVLSFRDGASGGVPPWNTGA